MLKKLTLTLTYISLLASCASLPDQIQKKEGRSLVSGINNNGNRVLIRAVDGGEVLMHKNYSLGTEAWLDPGPHNINTMCEFNYSWGKIIIPTKENISINVEHGKKYHLSGTIVEEQPNHCLVTVNAS